MAGLTAPTTFAPVNGIWTDGVTRFINGLVTPYDAASNADLTLGTSGADLSGASITFTLAGAAGYAWVFGTFAWSVSVAAAGNLLGDLVVDGSTGFTQVLDSSAQTFGFRAYTKHWVLTGLAAGSHTIKLNAHKDAAGATAKALAGSHISALVFDFA